MMRSFTGIVVGSIVTTSALAQVEVTDVFYSAFLHLESTLDGSVDVTESSTDFGDYMHTVEKGLGDPLAAWGAVMFDTTVLTDGSTISGTIIADSLSITTDTNSGYNYTDIGISFSFTLQSAMKINIVRQMTLVGDGGGFAYQDMRLWDVTNNMEVLRDDWWGDGYTEDIDTVLLAPGDYQLGMKASAEGEYGPPDDNGERTAHSELTFDVSFIVPAPGTTAVCLGAFWWMRRRR